MASTCLQLLRSIVFISNLLIWLAGLTLLGLGIGLRVEPSLIQYLKQHEVTNYYAIEVASYVIIIAGICLTIVGFLGCCGAWFLNQAMLVLYFLILMVVLGLEMTAAIMVNANRNQYKKTVDKELLTMIQKEYDHYPQKAAIVDEIQSSLQCCGVRSYSDWLPSTYAKNDPDSAEVGIGAPDVGRVPKSCCNELGLMEFPNDCGVSFSRQGLSTYKRFLHEQGCSDKFFNIFDKQANTIIIVCVSVAVLQLLGMLFSMMLCCISGAEQSNRKNHYY